MEYVQSLWGMAERERHAGQGVLGRGFLVFPAQVHMSDELGKVVEGGLPLAPGQTGELMGSETDRPSWRTSGS
jgi:hypothetical protein